VSSSPPPPPEHRRPARGEISLGDAITATARLGAVEQPAVASVVDALGLAVERLAPSPSTSVTSVVPPIRPLQWKNIEEEVAPDEDDAAASEGAIGVTVRFEDDSAGAPGWLDEVTAISFGPIGEQPEAEPPLPGMQVRAAMALVAAMRRPGRQLDLRRLIERASRMRPLAPPPIALELRTASFIQLLIDVGEGMEPYAEDVAFLEGRFLEVAGADRVEVHTFNGSPLRGVDPDVLTHDAEPWDRPPPRSLVVVLSELGAGGPAVNRERAGAAEWRELAAQVAECGASLRVLTPFPASRWPPGLADLAHVTNWESLATLVEHRA
jgi:hypothetical protein